MLIDRMIAPYFETNCWILSPGKANECVIVDPGIGNPNIVKELVEKLKQNNLKPVAVVITHGHLDHFFSVLPLTTEIPMFTYITKTDRFLLEDPMGALEKDGISQRLITEFGIKNFKEPAEIIELQDFSKLNLAGLEFEVIFSPGHTKGSAMFVVDNLELISGDVLFAGSIGRTDMPTGSAADMRKTLRERVLTLPDHLNVLPGHGRQTTIGNERVRNPYLQSDYLDNGGW
jgi:glyoxylase-like metal-dependent hydrolase (beta-lactamase superfamily II)